MKPVLFTFSFAATLAAQNVIQMFDPQFGMFTNDIALFRERPQSAPGGPRRSVPCQADMWSTESRPR